MPAAVAGRPAILLPHRSRHGEADSRAAGRDTEAARSGGVGASFYELRCDVGRRERCFWMIPARARNASFASPEFGKAAATSGSRTTTALPLVYRDANLLGEARLKSYSGRISSASTWLTTSALLSDFFMVPSFTAGRRPRADDANRSAPLSIHDREQTAHLRKAWKYRPLFSRRMTRISHDAT